MAPIIEIENLGKKFYIGEHQNYLTFRDVLVNLAKMPKRKFRSLRADRKEQTEASQNEFWALKDINLTVEKGEVLGIVGRNGAGKSTLLKILSRITPPTTGKITLRGSINSLLEVGTGFHQELTGRENIYLNSAILGMRRKQVDRLFDEIVDFADIGKFLDTPVKRYSSGMQVRLAFAIAAQLEPDILIIDEVLAVGDIAFQKKCLGKMEEVTKKQGRTVLFVSHNTAAIESLCNRCAFLDAGQIVAVGETRKILDMYSKKMITESPAEHIFEVNPRKRFQILSVKLLNKDNQASKNFTCDDPINVEVKVAVRQKAQLKGTVRIVDKYGNVILDSSSSDGANGFEVLEQSDEHTIIITIPSRTLGHGGYSINLTFESFMEVVDAAHDVCGFTLTDPRTLTGNAREGHFSTLLDWQLVK